MPANHARMQSMTDTHLGPQIQTDDTSYSLYQYDDETTLLGEFESIDALHAELETTAAKLLLRLEPEDGAEVKIEVSCDGGEWKTHKQFKRGPHKTVLVPIVPNRCDSFQIRISGTGRTVIRTMVREFEFGGDY